RRRSTPTKRLGRTKADPITFTMNVDQANIEETIADVYADLQNLMKIGELSKFKDILMNNTRKEIVRVFFALLFLFARGYIDIWMDENVIWVKMMEPPVVKEEEPETPEPVIES
ncbi:MAG: hypothetical protein ACFFEV_01625, partial [Candidatus Thorarchaeota archaeon]